MARELARWCEKGGLSGSGQENQGCIRRQGLHEQRNGKQTQRVVPCRASCKIKGTWKKEEPFFVATVPVPDDTPFEAAALEEYLIQKFGPPDNTRGVTRDVYDH